MGGEREFTTKPAHSAGDVTVGKTRIHESGGQVHFHDGDLKVAVKSGRFFKDWQDFRTNQINSIRYLDGVNGARVDIIPREDGDVDVLMASSTKAANLGAIDRFVNG